MSISGGPRSTSTGNCLLLEATGRFLYMIVEYGIHENRVCISR